MVTVITKTIGAGGGYDYATFTAAEADVENVANAAFGSRDLVANDGAIVFEAVAGTYVESVNIQSTLTTDATRQVTYKPAAGSEHGGDRTAGVIIDPTSGVSLIAKDDFTKVEGLVFAKGMAMSNDGCIADGCISIHNGTDAATVNGPAGTSAAPVVFENCVYEGSATGFGINLFSNSGDVTAKVVNCTFPSGGVIAGTGTGTTVTLDIVNSLVLASAGGDLRQQGAGTHILTGSNNYGPGTAHALPVALQGSPYPITATTSFSTPLGSGDYAVYMGATGALANVTGNDVWQQGVGPASNPDVPTTDINGVTRSGTSCNPGAFEADGFVAPTVITKTIGPSGDYADFSTAEADVENIPTGADLPFYNETIVFEAEAKTYTDRMQMLTAMPTDATRNITFAAAAGSEHGGSSSSGVIIDNSAPTSWVIWLRTPYTVFRGLVVLNENGATANYGVWIGQEGHGSRVEDCIIEAQGLFGVIVQPPNTFASTSSDPAAILTNNVVKVSSSASNTAFELRGDGGYDAYIEAINNTLIVEDGGIGVEVGSASGASTTASYKLINNLCVGSGAFSTYLEAGSGTRVTTGSNNFGNNTNPFPVAVQGSPYPITPTTNIDPGPGDWAIYDAATGALIDDPENDVLAGGIGPDANPDVPTTDILGFTRSGATTDPGAFEVSIAGLPGQTLITTMRQIYQQDASFSVGASSAGVERITHQLGPGSANYFTINSSTSAAIKVPRTAHALRIICVAALKPCDVLLDLDVDNSVFLGSVGGVGSVQADITYFWSFGQVVSDGTYPRVRIVNDTFSGDQQVYLWWHLA